jgi:hypothetical protein
MKPIQVRLYPTEDTQTKLVHGWKIVGQGPSAEVIDNQNNIGFSFEFKDGSILLDIYSMLEPEDEEYTFGKRLFSQEIKSFKNDTGEVVTLEAKSF